MQKLFDLHKSNGSVKVLDGEIQAMQCTLSSDVIGGIQQLRHAFIQHAELTIAYDDWTEKLLKWNTIHMHESHVRGEGKQ